MENVIQPENIKEGFWIEKNGSKNLIVTFGGINQGIGVPVFEFFNILREIDCDKVFVRDFHQMWYLGGLDAEIDSFEKLKHRLQEIIVGYEKVTFVGNSMGGYAAILFGTILKADRVISFAPQTFVNRLNRFWFRDKRWKKQISRIYQTQTNPIFLDLKKLLRKSENVKTGISIYHGKQDRLDNIHANRMKDFHNVELFSYSEGGHSIIKKLKESGELKKILENINN